jgi:hypothetical protein
MKRVLNVLGMWLITATAVSAGEPAAIAAFRQLSPCDYEAMFAIGEPVKPPAAKYRGAVLWVETAACPRIRARLQNTVWKGKHFDECGCFTNCFPGFEALPACGRIEASWADGKPAFVMDYPSDYRLFGNNRDELRQVAPGVWLGRVWLRCEHKFGGWFVLVGECRGH